MGGKPVPAETVQDDHVMGFQFYFPPCVGGIWFFSMYTYRRRYGLRLLRVEMADFTLGATRKSPDSHRLRMTAKAGHLAEPGVGAELAT